MKKLFKTLIACLLCLEIVGCNADNQSLQEKYSSLISNADKCISEIYKSEGMQKENIKLKYDKVIEANDKIEIIYSTTSDLTFKMIYTSDEAFDRMVLSGDIKTVHDNNEFPAIMLGMSELNFFNFTKEDIGEIIMLLENEGTVRTNGYRIMLSSHSNILEFKIVSV